MRLGEDSSRGNFMSMLQALQQGLLGLTCGSLAMVHITPRHEREFVGN